MKLETHSPSPARRPGLFSLRTLRRCLIGLAVLVTLVALAGTIENWRGKRAWERFRKEYEAKGEKFDLADFLPKPVPAEQNFAQAPFLAPLTDFQYPYGAPGEPVLRDTNAPERTAHWTVSEGNAAERPAPPFGNPEAGAALNLPDWQAFYRGNTNYPQAPADADASHTVLAALAKFDPLLDELRVASRRPYAFFPVQSAEDFQAQMPYLGALKSLSVILSLRSTALLAAGQPDKALDDMRLAWKIADSAKADPILISHLVRIALIHVATRTIHDGLVKHSWHQEQLAELEKWASSTDLLADYETTIRGERAYSNALLARMLNGKGLGGASAQGQSLGPWLRLFGIAPSGFLYQNQLKINRMSQFAILPVVNSTEHRAFPDRVLEAQDYPELRRATPYNVLARMLYPAVSKTVVKSAYCQFMLDAVALGCALERYRLANGGYPENLGALSPGLIAAIPKDLCNGKPLIYRRSQPNGYLIYSVGWNGVDDGGEIKSKPKGSRSQDLQHGDWIWRVNAGG